MEELFFDKNNFDVLLNVLSNDINSRSQENVNINKIRNNLYESMEFTFNNKKDNDKIDVLNKKTLIHTMQSMVQDKFKGIENIEESVKQFATNQPILVSESESESYPKDFLIDNDVSKNTKVLKEYNENEKIDRNFIKNLKISDINLFDKLTNKIQSERKFNLDSDMEKNDIFDGTIRNDSYNLLDKTDEILKNNYENKSTETLITNLDLNSADRNNWSVKSSPYQFEITFGTNDTFEGIYSPDILRNVFKIDLCQIIISDSKNLIRKYPFIYINIDELQNFTNSTSEHGRKSFVKLFKEKNWNESDNSEFMQYLYMDKCLHSNDFIIPIGSLHKLSLTLYSPNGTKINSPNDVFSIQQVMEYTDSLEFTTTHFFKDSDLNVDNRIKFTFKADGYSELDDFLNSTEHIVAELGNANPSNMYNSFKILKEEIIDSLTGNITYPNYNSNQSIPLNQNTTSQLMNLSAQTSVSFKIYSKSSKNLEEPVIV